MEINRYLKISKIELVTTTELESTTTKFVNEHLTIYLNWPNGRVFVYELSGCEFESRSNQLNFRFTLNAYVA